jgi:hypothetical protein
MGYHQTTQTVSDQNLSAINALKRIIQLIAPVIAVGVVLIRLLHADEIRVTSLPQALPVSLP